MKTSVIADQEIQAKIDLKTKPLGALGMLEKLAFRIASVQNTLSPRLVKPHIVVFAASHGIASEGVSAYPSEVTAQMVLNFISGGAAINVFTRQHGIELLLVDAGVDYDFDQNKERFLPGVENDFETENLIDAGADFTLDDHQDLNNAGAEHDLIESRKTVLAEAAHDFREANFDFVKPRKLINAKAGYGTQSFSKGPAMTAAECRECLEKGAEIVREISKTGCNVIGFGEMGIGNTSSAAAVMSRLLDIPIADCVGKGTGLSEDQLLQKQAILSKATELHQNVDNNPEAVLTTLGGFEIAMMCGAMQEAARLGVLVLVDGFIASVSYLCAFQMYPEVSRYAIFCHESNEKAHRLLLEKLGAEPVLKLDMRLGEGTGCALAYPLLQSAVAFMNEMASFESAGVSRKTENQPTA